MILDYVNYIFDKIPTSGFTYFDPDTIACPNSLNSYLLAVGGSVDAVNYIINNKNNVFSFVHIDLQVIMLKVIKQWVLVYLIM